MDGLQILGYSSAQDRLQAARKPAAATRESLDRRYLSGSALVPLTTGTLYMQGIALVAGDVVANLNFLPANTRSGTNFWLALFTPARLQVAITADQTSGTFSTATAKSLALTSSYTVPTDGFYYIGCVDVAGTPQQFRGISGPSAGNGLAPILAGNTTDTGLTTPGTAPGTAGAITAGTIQTYFYTS